MVTLRDIAISARKMREKEISSGIESFRNVILSYSKDRKQSDITKYIINFDGSLDFDYLFMNEGAKELTMDMINSLRDKQKISSKDRHSLEKLTTDCYNGHDSRAIWQGERYAERIRALTPYTDKVMNI